MRNCKNSSPLWNPDQVVRAFLFTLFCCSLLTELYAKSNINEPLLLDSALFADSLKTVKKEKTFKPKPQISGLLSAVVPGAGQIYNRKYWKAPIIWAAVAGVGYMIYSNHNTYTQYRDALRLRTDNDPLTIDAYELTYTDNDLLTLQDEARRSRDLWLILTTLGHALNVVDAVVDAHLSTFDVSDDLSMKINPALFANRNKINPGLSLSFTFR